MNDMPPNSTYETGEIKQLLQQIATAKKQINQHLIGQAEIVEQILVALIADGHVLVEGVPGLGKTLLVQLLADCFNGEFKRIQFTPDLMPADVTGHVIYETSEKTFRLRRGPVFTNLLLADEINRAPAKTQSALLEVMQEKQVTIEGNTEALPGPFMVMATQNPIEQEGTYPLPDAELDRFLMKLIIDYPSHEDEVQMTQEITTGRTSGSDSRPRITPTLSGQAILDLQQAASNIIVDEQVLDYAVRLVRATRSTSTLTRGAGSRACIALIRCARSLAMLNDADYVLPDDIKQIALPVLRHRVTLSAEMEIDGMSTDDTVIQILDSVEAPRL